MSIPLIDKKEESKKEEDDYGYEYGEEEYFEEIKNDTSRIKKNASPVVKMVVSDQQ